jgi:hypothetical protein
MLTKSMRWLVNGLRDSFTHDGRLRLPSKRGLWIFGAIMALVILGTVPQFAVDSYRVALDSGLTTTQALGQAVTTSALLLLVLAILGAVYLYVLSLLCSILIPDLVSMVRALWRGIVQIPAALRSCGQAIASAWRYVTSTPTRWRAMSADDKSFAKFMVLFMLVVATLGYFLWPTALTIYSWLPRWLQMSEWWMGALFIDVIMSTFAIAFIGPLLVSAVRLIRPRRRSP